MAAVKPKRANPALRLAFIRQIHVYVSVFVAPTLIFFALTGALQTFRIPDRKDAPVIVAKLARVHRDDVFAVKPPPKKPPAAKGEAKPEAPKAKPKEKASTTALKWFFALTSVAVAVTTLLGLWMALVYSKRRLAMWVVFLAGAAAPLLILML